MKRAEDDATEKAINRKMRALGWNWHPYLSKAVPRIPEDRPQYPE
jgi:hypothetical protein